MEKRRPHYSLDTIKATFVTAQALRITKSALTCAEALGLTLADIIAIIQGMTREQFYKSMTSNANSAIWQDVYHVPHETTVLYVKFTTDAEGYLVIGFKEEIAMAKDVKTQPCPECDGVMRYEKHDDVLVYKERERTIKTLGWWCTKCDEAILTGEPLVAHERAFQQFKAEVDGVLGPAEVAKIRTALGLSQRRASELLGGGPRAFQKYESGTQALSVAMSHLLRLLAKDPSRLRELSGPVKTKATASSSSHRKRAGDRTAATR